MEMVSVTGSGNAGWNAGPVSDGFASTPAMSIQDLSTYIRFLNWMPAALKMPEPELIEHAGHTLRYMSASIFLETLGLFIKYWNLLNHQAVLFIKLFPWREDCAHILDSAWSDIHTRNQLDADDTLPGCYYWHQRHKALSKCTRVGSNNCHA
ncbi:uncharacterized protein [Miscanthus floridulus]|uniref:uncharacterized protein n=1 Tax=Miscanthus floridulus TaxID=154761 RepID=UPI003457505D